MLLGFKLRRLLWRARRGHRRLWGARHHRRCRRAGRRRLVPRLLRASAADFGPIVAACALGGAGRRQGRRAAARDAATTEREPSLDDDGRGDIKRDLELGGALMVADLRDARALGRPVVARSTRSSTRSSPSSSPSTAASVGVPLVVVTLVMEALLYRAAVDHGVAEPRARQAAISHATFIGFFALRTSSSCRPR